MNPFLLSLLTLIIAGVILLSIGSLVTHDLHDQIAGVILLILVIPLSISCYDPEIGLSFRSKKEFTT